MTTILSHARTSLLSNQDNALAVAASPLKLTEFGVAANRTGFSPQSCRLIRSVLENVDISQPLPVFISLLLFELGHLPEQGNNELKKVLIGKRTTLPIKRSDFPNVIEQWLLGIDLDLIFGSLPAVQRSTRKPKINIWLTGEGDKTSWNGIFDKFVDFSSALLEGYMPWLLRACNTLRPLISQPIENLDWQQWADYVEKGVDSRWAVSALKSNAPGGRTVVAPVGRRWPSDVQNELDELGLSILTTNSGRQLITEIFQLVTEEVGGKTSARGKDIRLLQRWVYGRAGVTPTDEDLLESQ